jgi:hypothetical protein
MASSPRTSMTPMALPAAPRLTIMPLRRARMQGSTS